MSNRDNIDSEDRRDAVEKIRCGLEDVRAGRTTPAAQVFEELRREFGIPRNDSSGWPDRRSHDDRPE